MIVQIYDNGGSSAYQYTLIVDDYVYGLAPNRKNPEGCDHFLISSNFNKHIHLTENDHIIDLLFVEPLKPKLSKLVPKTIKKAVKKRIREVLELRKDCGV